MAYCINVLLKTIKSSFYLNFKSNMTQYEASSGLKLALHGLLKLLIVTSILLLVLPVQSISHIPVSTIARDQGLKLVDCAGGLKKDKYSGKRNFKCILPFC